MIRQLALRLVLALAILLIIGGLCALTGCADPLEGARRQQVADSAATIYEAASAIEQGVAPGAPLTAIKHNASAIAAAEGMPYPPASASAAAIAVTTAPKGSP